MEDLEQESGARRSESGAVRSRWTPKPEQILILESIFNSGMVNPPKDETVRIRKLLEKFGSVGDANVFYWFQNRRSRSRRRQRQIQATLTAAGDQPHHVGYENAAAASCYHDATTATSSLVGPASSYFGNESSNSNGLFPFSGQLHQNSFFDSSDSHYQSGVITVFINGVATEVGRGAVDMKAIFGGDFMLFHSSGVAVDVDDCGFLVQGLQHGESYFLVPRHS